MPNIDLLILPLIGGYWFLNTFYYTKFYHQRVESQRLIFNSFIIGVFLSLLGLLIDQILEIHYTNFREFLGKLNPINYNGLNLAFLIFAISYPLAKFFNLFLSKKRYFASVINKWGDDFDKLFWESLKSKMDEDKLLMVTTKSNNVYVGYVNKISKPITNAHIIIIPNFSGYRDKDSKEFFITTNYLSVLKSLINEGKEDLIDKKMGVIIPKKDIELVSKFDMEVFEKFLNVIS